MVDLSDCLLFVTVQVTGRQVSRYEARGASSDSDCRLSAGDLGHSAAVSAEKNDRARKTVHFHRCGNGSGVILGRVRLIRAGAEQERCSSLVGV